MGLFLCLNGFTLFPFGSSTRQLGTVATMAVPRRAELEGPNLLVERPTWVAFRLDRFHAWAIGSDTPYRGNLFVALHLSASAALSYDEAERYLVGELNGGGDGWRELRRDEAWWIGQGRYTVNLLDEPIWRLAYRDPGRRLSAVWQVYQKDWSLEAAKAALLEMLASLQWQSEPDWSEIADRPRRMAEENDRKADNAFAWLAERGFTPLLPERPVTHDGITVEVMQDPERRIMLFHRLAAAPPDPLPAYVTLGQRSWSEEGWVDRMEGGDYYPMPGTRRQLDASLAKPGPHYYLIRTIRLDEIPETAFHLEEFFTFVETHD